MRINSINPMFFSSTVKNTAFNGKRKQIDDVLTKGMDGYSLKMEGNASKYFEVVENLSNPKLGSKFIIEPKSKKYNGIRLLITSETTIKNDDMFIGIKKDTAPSFKGRVYGSIRQDERGIDYKMQDAYIDFWWNGMHDNIAKNHLNPEADDVKGDYNFYVPSDGDGTRYKDITSLQGGVTKPASAIPAEINGKQMSLIHGVLTNFAKTGKTDRMFDFVRVKPAQGSAYAFLEGIKDSKISDKKPVIFCWGDNFSDINISKLMKEHEKTNSGFSVTVIKEDKDRSKSLGVIKPVSLDSSAIEEFEEKPTDEDYINSCLIPEFGENKLLASVGPYILAPEAVHWLKEKYTEDPSFFKDPNKGYDFSSCIIKPMVKAFNNGEIVSNETGEPLQMRYVIKQDDETWSDLGSQKDFSAALKDIKTGTKYLGLPAPIIDSMKQNVDENGNITFNKRTRENFEMLINDLSLDAKNVISYCK